MGADGVGAAEKIAWSGIVTAVEPRIRLTRSFDQRQHGYLGYLLAVVGSCAGAERTFRVALGTAAYEKHGLRVGDRVRGEAVAVTEQRRETADLHKVSKLALVERASAPRLPPPPWVDLAPPLDVYRQRGHRRLLARNYDTSCVGCIWACKMAVEMIIDPWNPKKRRFRTETFCYRPLSCPIYRAGPTRKVPGRRGMSWEEEDWVDADQVSHRSPDE